MAELEDLRKRADSLLERYNTASKKRSELKGQLEAVKADLAALAEEIKAAGFNKNTGSFLSYFSRII